MCGIIAVVRRPSTRAVPAADGLLADLDSAWGLLAGGPSRLSEAAGRVAAVDKALRGVPGVHALLEHDTLAKEVGDRVSLFERWIAATEADLDAGRLGLSGWALEDVNAAMVALKDAVWGLGHDRLRTARAVGDLAGRGRALCHCRSQR